MDAIRNNYSSKVHLAMSGTDYTLCGIRNLDRVPPAMWTKSLYGNGQPDISRTLFLGYNAIMTFYNASSHSGGELYHH